MQGAQLIMKVPRRQAGCVSGPHYVKDGRKTTAATLLNESCCNAKKELEPHSPSRVGHGMAWHRQARKARSSGLWTLARSSFFLLLC